MHDLTKKNGSCPAFSSRFATHFYSELWQVPSFLRTETFWGLGDGSKTYPMDEIFFAMIMDSEYIRVQDGLRQGPQPGRE
jgi:hypothetical protein